MTDSRLIRSILHDGSRSYGRLTTYLNLYSYYVARKSPDLFERFDVVKLDGIALVAILRTFGIRRKRVSFDMTSDAATVFSEAEGKGMTVYLIGSEPDISSVAAQKILNEYPKLRVVGCRAGYFRDDNERELVLAQIAGQSPDIVVCGMGTPYQERFLVDLQCKGFSGRGYTCGGFLHQTAKGGLEYYPKVFDRLNLRWVYRIYDEPKLIKRYFFYYPLSMLLFMVDYFAHQMRRD